MLEILLVKTVHIWKIGFNANFEAKSIRFQLNQRRYQKEAETQYITILVIIGIGKQDLQKKQEIDMFQIMGILRVPSILLSEVHVVETEY